MKLLILLMLFSSAAHAQRMGNKYFIYNKLHRVFGGEAKALLITEVMKNSTLFSGTCDTYRSYVTKGSKVDEEHTCFRNNSDSYNQYWGKLTPRRILVMTKVCTSLANNKKTLSYFKKTYDLKKADELISAFVGHTGIHNLEKLKKELLKIKDDKQRLIRTCSSPFWQYI